LLGRTTTLSGNAILWMTALKARCGYQQLAITFRRQALLTQWREAGDPDWRESLTDALQPGWLKPAAG
jgi:hypothetical protein